jgi:hypothetical protein
MKIQPINGHEAPEEESNLTAERRRLPPWPTSSWSGDELNESHERMLKGDVKYRFVINNASLAV